MGAGRVMLDPHEARRRIHDGGEIAVLDVREAGQFGEGHALFAISCPYSILERRAPELVPRRAAPVLLIDDGDGVAQRAAGRLRECGLTDVSVMAGGMPGWEAQGFPVYKGVNVPSKLLGELAEAAWHPARVSAEELAAWKAQGRSFDFYDARPPAEYTKMRVPGARCLPNGELAHRLPAIAEDTKPIVITCAGRTRGIVGAIGLKLTGYSGPVMALENGTQGWALSGEPLERGNSVEPYPALTAAQLEQSRQAAMALIRRYGLMTADADGVAALLADTDATTYLFDVRSAEEAKSDPLAGAIHAPSGQLVQATDQWVGVRHARLILLDDGGMRAALAAFWLHQLGYRPYVALIDDPLRDTLARRERGRHEMLPQPPRLAGIDAVSALQAVASDAARFVDMRGSLAYRSGHVESAVWLVRPRVDRFLPAMAGARICLIADDTEAAAWTADDLRRAGMEDVVRVEGGYAALVAAGARIVATPEAPDDYAAIDHLFFVHDRHDDNLEASRQYLAWETGLIAQMDALERAAFDVTLPA